MNKGTFRWRFILFVLILITLKTQNAYSQNSMPKHIVSFNFLASFGPIHPNLELTYEYRFNDRFSIEAGINPVYRGGSSGMCKPKISKRKGIVFKIEPKLALYNKYEVDTLSQTFVSFEVYYARLSYSATKYMVNQIGKDLHAYAIKSSTLGLVPKIGYRRIQEHFHFEVSGGFGRRLIRTINDYKKDFSKLSSYCRSSFHPEESGFHNWYLIVLNTKAGVAF